MKVRYWIWVVRIAIVVWAAYGLYTRNRQLWVGSVVIAALEILEAIDSNDNWIRRRKMAFAALFVFMAAVSWWVQ
jgi:hypothetical protein